MALNAREKHPISVVFLDPSGQSPQGAWYGKAVAFPALRADSLTMALNAREKHPISVAFLEPIP